MQTRAVNVPLDLYKVILRIAKKNDRTVPAQLRVILRNLKKSEENT